MIFVPLPLFATIFLGLLACRFVIVRDMSLRTHQLFAVLILLFAAQSLLTSLRWGYGISAAALPISMLAPVLPVTAYMAYAALSGQPSPWRYWPAAIIALNWVALVLMPTLPDVLIPLTYFGFGGLLIRRYWQGADQVSLSPFNDTNDVLLAMGLTGLALLSSALTDIYVIYDFITTGGAHAGLVLTIMQTSFVLIIGACAVFGRSAVQTDPETPPQQQATSADSETLARLETLLTAEKLFRDEDLSLRRLSRRLGLSDRHVSQAVNRITQLSVSQYINGFRITEACRLLRDTNQTVLGISLASGFATKSNFNREFLRITQQTPSDWRRNHTSAP